MFDPVVKAKWIAALRSGEYLQCAGVLHTKTKGAFCCLGVLAEIEPDRAIEGKPDGFEGGLLSDASWVAMGGCARVCSVVGSPLEQTTLSNMNDAGYTFAEIADYIEMHY